MNRTTKFETGRCTVNHDRCRLEYLAPVLMLFALIAPPAQAASSVQLTDVIKSNGNGDVNLFKDITAQQLEALRVDNGGNLIFAVDVNEDASGTESSVSQGIAVKSARLTVSYDDGSQKSYSSFTTKTRALLAEAPGTGRQLYYTLLGESGSNRITANNVVQDQYDATLTIRVTDYLAGPALGKNATSAIVTIRLLDTNVGLGDPEAFYDYSNGFEDLAIVNAADAGFLNAYEAGRDEAPTVILGNGQFNSSSQTVTTWNYFPSANSYYLVGYEDYYPNTGDYDFNDLTVGYQIKHGLNGEGKVVKIQGVAYLITRGAAFTHDWKLRFTLPTDAIGTLKCRVDFPPNDPRGPEWCSANNGTFFSGTTDLIVFGNTAHLFPAPAGSMFVNTEPGHPFVRGPRSTFSIEFDTPVAQGSVGGAPFDPQLYVHNTGQTVRLLQVNASYKDANGYPYGMLMPGSWRPPSEFIDTDDAYPTFRDFVLSEGGQAVSWYASYNSQKVIDMPSSSVWAW